MTYRQQILNNIKGILENIVGVQKVEINQPTPTDTDTIPYPSAFLYSDEALPEPGPYGYQSWIWTVVLEAWTKDDTEELLADIYDALAVDETIGGAATDSRMLSSDFLIVDADNDVKGVYIKYEIKFRHPVRTMKVA